MSGGDFVHYDLGHLGAGAVVEVELASRANVQLVDSTNFQNYRNGRGFNYYGGEAITSPVRIEVPHAAHWHVVLDLGGYPGTIRSSVHVLTSTV